MTAVGAAHGRDSFYVADGSQFVSTGLTRGPWIVQERGVGLADTRLLDEQGPLGRSVQSLVVADV